MNESKFRLQKNFGLLGVPFGLCARWPGCNRAPSTLRAWGLVYQLEALSTRGIVVKDFGDTPEIAEKKGLKPSDPTLKFKDEFLAYSEHLISKIHNIYEEGFTPLIVGGDHSISIATIAAAVKFNRAKTPGFRIGVLWVDAHPDLCTQENSWSGNIHGMSVAHLLGHGDTALSEIGGFASKIKPSEIVYVGLRDIDPPERDAIAALGIKAFSMKEVDRRGIGAVMDEALEYLNNISNNFWLSFDLDVCDPEVTPGVGTPVRGGLTFREAHLVMEMVAESTRCCGIELVEYSPDRDTQGLTGKIAIGLIESAIGRTIL